MHYGDEAQTKEEMGKIYSQTCTSSREQNKDEDDFIFLTAEPTLSARGPDFVILCGAAAVVVVVVVVVLVWV